MLEMQATHVPPSNKTFFFILPKIATLGRLATLKLWETIGERWWWKSCP